MAEPLFPCFSYSTSKQFFIQSSFSSQIFSQRFFSFHNSIPAEKKKKSNFTFYRKIAILKDKSLINNESEGAMRKKRTEDIYYSVLFDIRLTN